MDLANWMGLLKDNLKDKKINEIVIPGSHDSGSYCITRKSKRTDLLPSLGPCLNVLVDLVGAPWSQTQEYDLQDHLCLGVRYLDLRVIQDRGAFCLVHGFQANDLFAELDNIAQFVARHPSEIVILDFNHVYKCTDAHVCKILDRIQEIFGSKLCPPLPLNETASYDVLTYGEMMSSGQQVIVGLAERPECYNSTFVHRTLACKYNWIWGSDSQIISPWANTTKVNKLKDFLKRTMSRKRPPNSLHVTQAILTPKLGDTVKGVVRSPRNISQLSDKLSPYLAEWFTEFKHDYNLNIALVDYLTPDLIEHLVRLNISSAGPVSERDVVVEVTSSEPFITQE